MSKKRILVATAVFATAILVLTGCLSREEKKELNAMEDKAEAYLEEKYGEDFKMSDSGYDTYQSSMFTYNSSNMWFTFTDGTMVYYQVDEEGNSAFYDDRQSEKINKAIIDEILTPLFDEIGDIRIGRPETDMDELFRFSNRYDEKEDISFYHEYYNGNIESFLSKESAYIWMRGYIYLICNEDEWQNSFDLFEKGILQYFRGQLDGAVRIVAMNEQGWQNDSYYFHQEGAFAELTLYGYNQKREFNVQKYIQAADDIYICAHDNEGQTLEDGDIAFEPVEGIGEFEGKPAYKVVFSDRIKSKFSSDGAYYCYVKIDSGEDEATLYQYDTENKKSYELVSNWEYVGIREDCIYWLDVNETTSSGSAE